MRFEEGFIKEVVSEKDDAALAKGLILPSFYNAHTHLGDSVVLEEPKGALEDIVRPPDGLKFRRLREATSGQIVRAMGKTLVRMVNSGTAGFCDFREGGIEGSEQLRDALREAGLSGLILGRPEGLLYDAEEVRELLKVADGIAVSGVSDWPHDELRRLAHDVKRAGRSFALHGSEGVREDIDSILDLGPDFLVHMTQGTADDWGRCAQEGVPVVVCPRSQMFFGRVPDIPGMKEAGLDLYLGTDNAMLANPSMLTELQFAHRAARLRGGTPPEGILPMAFEGAKLLSGTHPITIQEGSPSNLVVLDAEAGGNAAYQVVKASEADITLLSLGPAVWIRQGGWLMEAGHDE